MDRKLAGLGFFLHHEQHRCPAAIGPGNFQGNVEGLEGFAESGWDFHDKALLHPEWKFQDDDIKTSYS